MAASWIESEPGFFALRHELRRLIDRASRRRRWVLLLAFLTSLLGVMMTLRAPHDYNAQITVRVTEVVDFHLPRSAWTDRELRSFVTQVAFTNEVLGKIYQDHLADIAPAPNLARGIERLREDVEIKTVRNRIMVEAQAQSGPRSAMVILRYAAAREDRAIAVLKALATPIIESSTKRRRREAQQEMAEASLRLEDAKRVAAAARAQALAQAGLPISGAGSISPVRMVELDSALKEANLRVDRFQQDMDAAARRNLAESRKSGIDFEVTEEGVERPLPLLPLLLAVAVLTFLCSLPIATVVVGAFASTVDTLEDVRRLGVPVLGHLPRLAIDLPASPFDVTSQPAGRAQARLHD
jgi:hypothetical protein